MWSAEYTAKKGDVALALYRRRNAAPTTANDALPVLLLVHGALVSALPTFDLHVPGEDDTSMMDAFARAGYDVWALDCENYGRSDRTRGTSDIADGAADIRAAMDVIERETGVRRAHLFGESAGALRATKFAALHPQRAGRLVLSAYVYRGKDARAGTARMDAVEQLRAHPRRVRDQAAIDRLFAREETGTFPATMPAAIGAMELAHGTEVPAGNYIDMLVNIPLVEPSEIEAPVMIVTGAGGGMTTPDDLLHFFRCLPNANKTFAVIPAIGLSAIWSNGRHRCWHWMRAFFEQP